MNDNLQDSPKNERSFEFYRSRKSRGFHARFFQNGELVTDFLVLPTLTIAEVQALSDQWLTPFDPW